MPITPFHFGPGALLHAVAPRYVSFVSFCAANVLIDIESLYNLIYRHYPVHAFFHTYIGATLVVITMIILFLVCRSFAARLRLPNTFQWQQLTVKQVVIGAALGAYSHVALDSIMHHDIQPLSPFTSNNTLLGIVSLGTLHFGCMALGVLGLLVLATRWFATGDRNAP
jgi:hypothetical protein